MVWNTARSLPATAAYGTWSLVAKWGTTSIACDFQVLVYRTPKFKMSATVAKPHYTVGDVVTGDVLASYYDQTQNDQKVCHKLLWPLDLPSFSSHLTLTSGTSFWGFSLRDSS